MPQSSVLAVAVLPWVPTLDAASPSNLAATCPALVLTSWCRGLPDHSMAAETSKNPTPTAVTILSGPSISRIIERGAPASCELTRVGRDSWSFVECVVWSQATNWSGNCLCIPQPQ
jgi:hypothetical protein